MHVVFVHQNYPAQFGHVADYLGTQPGFRCTLVTERAATRTGTVELIQYCPQGGATATTHYCSRSFENTIWHSQAVYDALKARSDIRPDVIVGHSGYVSTLFLRQLYPGVPIINYFEYYYHTSDSDMDFRPDMPMRDVDALRASARNAILLLDLENCERGYSPTHWQRDRFPTAYQDKIRVIFDGIDTQLWQPQASVPRRVGQCEIPSGMKVVTYAARGMEAMRGFDIFMRFAKKLAARRPDVIFLIAGEDRVCYGGDERITGSKSFKDWVLSQDDYDLSRITFLGLLPKTELASLFRISDLHVYLTVPFILSWSLLNALACGATVLASDTAPVREVVEDGQTGLLAGFFDVDGMVDRAVSVLGDKNKFAHLGDNGVALVKDKYSVNVCVPKLVGLLREVG